MILEDWPEFPDNTSWRFVRDDYEFPDPLNPWLEEFPESSKVHFNSNSVLITENLNFKGIKIGDVNCSAENDLPPQGPEIIVVIEDKDVVKDEIVKVPVRVEGFSTMEAYQLGIEFNSTVLEQQAINAKDLNRGADPGNFGLTDVDDGKIRTVWLHNDASDLNNTVIDTSLVDNSALFELEFKAKVDFTRSSSSSKLSDLLRLNDEILANRAYSEKGEHHIKLKFVEPGYFEKVAKLNTLLSPIKCYPNPAKSEINFQLNLRQESNIHLQIFDSLGKLLSDKEMTLSSGVQTINMENIADWSKGLYFYTLTAGEDVETGKFVKQ